MNVYLISVQNVKDNAFIDNNTDDKTVKLALLQAQEQILEPAIGTPLYEKLLSGIVEGSMATAYQNLILNKIYKVLIYGTQYMVARNLLMRMTNSSIVQDGNTNSTAISISDLNTMRNEFEISYKHHLNKLNMYLLDNQATFPEYLASDTDGFEANAVTPAINFYYDGPEITQ